MVGADLCVRPFGGPTRRSAPTRVGIEKGVRSHLIVPILSEKGAGNHLGVSKTAQAGV